jgi:hypothetical protein
MLRHVTSMTDAAHNRGSARLTHLIAILMAVLALVPSACTLSSSPATGASAESSEVTQLKSVSDLQERFNQDSGKVRLILLVSPT